ncbi:MAG: hypothetical protein NTY32_13020 [Bacteroidia bacterium]|nr:hypothetical protein [Bacteroidia bacterium]
MKKYTLLLIVLISPLLSLVAQDKVLEKSGKQPAWLNNLEKDFIIASGTGLTIQEAQEKALTVVREQIVGSVAVNVKTKTESSQAESITNKTVASFLEKFSSQTSTESSKVPFLQGISLSKVESFYWVKQQRKDKSVYYTYHIRYPFPKVELAQLVFEFKLRDEQLTKDLQALLAQLETVSSVEQIEKNIGELTVLSDYFMDGRKSQAELGITSYKAMFPSLELAEVANTIGELTYCLRLGTRVITTAKKPVMKSDCARITSNNNCVVKYDYSNCYEEPENNILIKYRFGNTDVQKKFYFDISENKASIFVNEPFHLTASANGGSTIDASMLDMTVVSKYAAAFTIEKVTLEFPGSSPVIIENIGQSFSGKGNHGLKLQINTSIPKDATSTRNKTLPLLSGYIQYKSDNTGELKTYRIYNHSYTTDW